MSNRRREWTKAEDEFLATNYDSMPKRDIADKLNRKLASVYSRALLTGLTCKKNWASDDQIKMALRRWYPEGLSDAEISRNLGSEIGTHVSRRRVGVIRRSMDLDVNTHSEHQRRKIAQKTREQIKAKGLNSLADERTVAYGKWKESLGWPADLTMRAVQALELFYTFGPMTRIRLCKLMGVSSKKRTAPTSNAKGGTVLAELSRRGLISRMAKQVPNGRGVKGRIVKVDLYCLNHGVKPNGRNRKRRDSDCGDRHTAG